MRKKSLSYNHKSNRGVIHATIVVPLLIILRGESFDVTGDEVYVHACSVCAQCCC